MGRQELPLRLRIGTGARAVYLPDGLVKFDAHPSEQQDRHHSGSTVAPGTVDDDGFAVNQTRPDLLEQSIELFRILGNAVVGNRQMPELSRDSPLSEGRKVFGRLLGNLFIRHQANDMPDTSLLGGRDELAQRLVAAGHGAEVDGADGWQFWKGNGTQHDDGG
jgi:hypothetical protein